MTNRRGCLVYEITQDWAASPFAQPRGEARPAPVYRIDLTSRKRERVLTLGPRGSWLSPAYVDAIAVSQTGTLAMLAVGRYGREAAGDGAPRLKVELVDLGSGEWLREFPIIDRSHVLVSDIIWLDSRYAFLRIEALAFLLDAEMGRYRELEFPFLSDSPGFTVAYADTKGLLVVGHMRSLYFYDLSGLKRSQR